MKITPADNYKSPNIPTRDYVDDNPEILNHIPRRWMSDAAVITALAGTVMLLSISRSVATQKNANVAKIAPVFLHGDGKWARPMPGMPGPPVYLSENEVRNIIRNNTPNRSVQLPATGKFIKDVSPTFLSETEAQEVIRDEASKYDILFNTSDKQQTVISVPKTTGKQGIKRYIPFKLDGSDNKRHIYFEFISRDDTTSLQSSKIISPVSTYNESSKITAKELRSVLRKACKRGIYGVFYDPVIYRTDAIQFPEEGDAKVYASTSLQAKIKAKSLLRAQVKDFIKWLKTEGVI